MKKRFGIFLLCIELIICNIIFLVPKEKADAATKYWLIGMYESCELYLKENKIVIKGEFKRCTSEKNYKNYRYKGKKVKYKSKTIRVSKNCKIVDSADFDIVYEYNGYISYNGISPSQNVRSIMTGITIKNGKVTRIRFSA